MQARIAWARSQWTNSQKQYRSLPPPLSPTLQASTTILHPTRERVVGLCMLVVASSALHLCLSWQLNNRSLAFRGHFDASTYDLHYSRRYVKRLVKFDLVTSFVFLSSLHLVTSFFSSDRYSTWWGFFLVLSLLSFHLVTSFFSFSSYCSTWCHRLSLSHRILVTSFVSFSSDRIPPCDVVFSFPFYCYSTWWRRLSLSLLIVTARGDAVLLFLLSLFLLVTSFVSFSSYHYSSWWRRSSLSLLIIPPGDAVSLFLFWSPFQLRTSFQRLLPFLSSFLRVNVVCLRFFPHSSPVFVCVGNIDRFSSFKGWVRRTSSTCAVGTRRWSQAYVGPTSLHRRTELDEEVLG